MYIVKNAWKNIVRGKGRNILIGIIIMVVTASSCIALAINGSGNKLIDSYKEGNPVEVSFNIDRMSFRNDMQDSTVSIEPIDEELVKKIGESNLLSGYYYTLEASASSSDITAIDTEDYFKKDDTSEEDNGRGPRMDGGLSIGGVSMGDYRLTAYSDLTYNEDFISGDKKIVDGTFFNNDSTGLDIVISEELASANELSVGDTIKLYNPSDDDTTYEYKIVGIFSVNSSEDSDTFMNFNIANTANQMYVTMTGLNTIKGESTASTGFSSGINAVFYLKSADDIEKFESEAKELGLDDYYTASSNLDQILATVEPIQNISNFSMTFLVVILVVGVVVIGIINMINIRERKYEIGVLRAIGMTKSKVTLQLISETFIVALIALTFGTGIGKVLSQPVTNKMLASEIESQESSTEEVQNNFGGPGGNGGSFNIGRPGMNNDVDYVSELTVSVDFVTIVELIGLNLLLIVASSTMAIIVVNKYNPNRILQNRA